MNQRIVKCLSVMKASMLCFALCVSKAAVQVG